jgi:Glyoxalase/Bleomycin resistance protein/Dioxygenase superfamily
MSVQLRIGDGRLHLADEFPEFGVLAPPSIGGTAVVLSLDLEDAEAVFAQALGSGAEVRHPLHEASWGDLHGQLDDPFGHRWNIAQHLRERPTRRSWPPPLRRSPEMRYRLLGPFGLRVSEFCLSAMVFGDPRGPWGATRTDAQAMVERYAEAGGNFIDAASNYAGGDSSATAHGSAFSRGVRDRTGGRGDGPPPPAPRYAVPRGVVHKTALVVTFHPHGLSYE